MATPLHGSTEAQLAALEDEARVVEAELEGLRRAIAALRAQQQALAAPAEGMTLPLEATPMPHIPPFDGQADSTEPIPHSGLPTASLPPLAAHDPLRAKWQLSEGLPDSDSTQALPPKDEGDSKEAHLRLAGILEDGSPWECRIPFATIARAEGVSLGRDPGAVNVELPDNSISRRHALLEITDAGLVITALGSMNGISVDECALNSYDRRVPLTHGMALGIGEARLRVEFIR